jgi:hypothetical protein
MLEIISILLALLIGFLVVQIFDPVRNMRPRWAAMLFDAALGTGVGMGLTSILFLLLDVSGVASAAAIFGVDVVLIGVLAWQWQRTRAGGVESSSDATPSGFRWTWLLALAFGAALLMSGIRLVQMAAALPVGEWDAWALWNLRAKFLAGPAGAWRYALSPLLKNSHPDYPLLLPAFVARVWKAGGTMDAIVPILTALLFFAALIALLVSVIALLRGAAAALLAGLVILSTTSLLTWASSQYADIPLAFYYLAAIALLFLSASQTEGERWTLLWAGLCTGLAAWTKNEGIAFLATIAVVYLAFTFWQRRSAAGLFRSGWMLAGAVPGILLTLWLKFFLAPAVDPLVTQGASGLARLADPSRYAQVANGFFNNLLNLGSGISHPLILLAILAILVRWKIEERYKQPSLIATAVLLLVFLSYCLVYLITPYGLAWQVQSSFDRLLLQIWPSVLLVFFIQLRNVADPVAAAVPAKGATRKSPVRSNKPVTVGNTLGSKVK